MSEEMVMKKAQGSGKEEDVRSDLCAEKCGGVKEETRA